MPRTVLNKCWPPIAMCCSNAVPKTMKLTLGGREVVKDSGMNGQNIQLIRLFNEALKEGKNSANDHFSEACSFVSHSPITFWFESHEWQKLSRETIPVVKSTFSHEFAQNVTNELTFHCVGNHFNVTEDCKSNGVSKTNQFEDWNIIWVKKLLILTHEANSFFYSELLSNKRNEFSWTSAQETNYTQMPNCFLGS